MSDPTGAGSATTPPVRGGAPRPTKALPTDRVGFERQLAILRAYGAVAAEEGKTAAGIAEVVPIHPSSVSTCNPFFSENGLIERAGQGNKASEGVVAYFKAMEWDAATAGERLAPALRLTWFWKALADRLSFRPLEEKDVVRVLAEECSAGPDYRPQIKTLVDYMAEAKLVVRDGNLVRKGPTATPTGNGGAAPPRPEGEAQVEPTAPAPRQPSPPLGQVAAGIGFDISVRVEMSEMAGWSSDRIAAFFAGVAAVIAAKNQV